MYVMLITPHTLQIGSSPNLENLSLKGPRMFTQHLFKSTLRSAARLKNISIRLNTQEEHDAPTNQIRDCLTAYINSLPEGEGIVSLCPSECILPRDGYPTVRDVEVIPCKGGCSGSVI